MTTPHPRYGIGIDLCTSNCAVGLWNPRETRRTVPLTQLESPGHLVSQDLLPPCLYLPLEGEVSSDTGCLPWKTEFSGVVSGVFAHKRGALLPERYISSAKSWLCCEAVDRRAALLPWESSLATKLSPVDCSRLLLDHLRAAILASYPHAHEEAEWVLTVPASFDEVARLLSIERGQSRGDLN